MQHLAQSPWKTTFGGSGNVTVQRHHNNVAIINAHEQYSDLSLKSFKGKINIIYLSALHVHVLTLNTYCEATSI